MTSDPNSIIGPVLCIFFALAVFMIVMRKVADQERAKMKGAAPLPLSYHYVRCDCTATMECPQGRKPTEGDPYCCRIWKQDEKGINDHA